METSDSTDTLTISTLDMGDIFIDTSDLVFTSSVTNGVITQGGGDLYVETDIVFRSEGSETSLLETLQEQQLQIAALTDMITEMVERRNFDVDMDIDRRVEQKKFLKRLSSNQ
jgi:NurA-like 5'-3' nuclease